MALPIHTLTALTAHLWRWLIPALWLTRAVEASIGLPKVPNLLAPQHDTQPAGSPTLTVIVPACNEAENIEACLRSLLAQDYPITILAVNDRSTDGTGAIMDTLAGPNLQVLHITTLPAGWLGKTHAMSVAAARATSDFLLFTDADILFRPDALRRALANAVATEADHLVLGPTTIIRRWDEAAFLAFFQLFGLWAARPWRVADPTARDAIGIGAFNLIRRSAYESLGGFSALRLQVVEDLALGRRVKHFGFRQRFVRGQGLVRVHWASGVPGLVRVMTKNTFAATNYHPWLLLLGCLWLVWFCILPFVNAIRFVPDYPATLSVACIVYAYYLISRITGLKLWNAALAPIAAAIFIFTLLRSMLTTLRQGGVEWRGTFYPLAELRKNAAPLMQRRRRQV